MKGLDQKKLVQILKFASEQLQGEWVMIGGTVLPSLGVDHRFTTDLDLIPLHDSKNSDLLALMDIAVSVGLPPETVNAAGGFFLKKVKGFEKRLVELQRGKKSVIYRPDATLFIELKCARMSESDLEDCLQMMKFAKKNREPLDSKHLIQLLEKLMSKNADDSSKESKFQRWAELVFELGKMR